MGGACNCCSRLEVTLDCEEDSVVGEAVDVEEGGPKPLSLSKTVFKLFLLTVWIP